MAEGSDKKDRSAFAALLGLFTADKYLTTLCLVALLFLGYFWFAHGITLYFWVILALWLIFIAFYYLKKAMFASYVYLIVFALLVLVSLVLTLDFIPNQTGSNTKDDAKTKSSDQELTATTADPYPFDGKYFGETNSSQGLLSTGVTIKNSQVNGSAIYTGPVASDVTELVSGTVNAKGEITGTFAGAGSVNGQMVGVNGSYTGKVYIGKVVIDYKTTDSGKTVSGTLTLKKD